MEINVNGVSITLTQNQLKEINDQINKKITAENITFELAFDICKENNLNPDPNDLFKGDLLKLKTIAKAINFIDNNNKEWIPNFNHIDSKYYPYFISDGGLGLGFYSSRYDGSYFHGMPAYFLKRETSNIIGKRFIHIYKQLM
jgi:hypothetical protein